MEPTLAGRLAEYRIMRREMEASVLPLATSVDGRRFTFQASLHGLTFRSDVEIDGDVLHAPISDSYKEFMKGAYSKVSARHYRTIGAGPEVDEDGTHTTVNETIDGSVFERWRKVAAYRPPNLAEWAKRRNVDPANLSVSVRTDDASMGAPD